MGPRAGRYGPELGRRHSVVTPGQEAGKDRSAPDGNDRADHHAGPINGEKEEGLVGSNTDGGEQWRYRTVAEKNLQAR